MGWVENGGWYRERECKGGSSVRESMTLYPNFWTCHGLLLLKIIQIKAIRLLKTINDRFRLPLGYYQGIYHNKVQDISSSNKLDTTSNVKSFIAMYCMLMMLTDSFDTTTAQACSQKIKLAAKQFIDTLIYSNQQIVTNVMLLITEAWAK